MSKGEIIEHKGEGLYRVRLKYAVDRVQAELSRANDQIAQLAIDVPKKKLEVLEAENAVSATAREINLLIPAYRDDVEANADAMTALQSELIRRQSTLSRLRYAAELLIAENLGLLRRRRVLNQIPESTEIDAWCSDYTRSLTGDIGLIDINDEGGGGVLIQPGYDDAAAYTAQRDGALTPRAAQIPAQVYFNSAILPGIQKWRPRYRIGQISNLRNDSCTLTLDDAYSSAQNLEINQQSQYDNVPIAYMSCNGAAFSDGDRVLASFAGEGTDPIVIGFEKEPKSCALAGIIYVPGRLDMSNTLYNSQTGYFGASRTDYGQPHEDEAGLPINYPIGTSSGDNPAWTSIADSGGFETKRGQQDNYGTANWIGRGDDVLSWHAPPGRMRSPSSRVSDSRPFYNELKLSWGFGRSIYYKQRAINLGVGRIMGAAFRTDGLGQEWIYAVNTLHEIYRAPLDNDREVSGEAEEIASYSPDDEFESITGWYFSESGDKAVSTFNGKNRGNSLKVVARFDARTGAVSDQVFYERERDVGTKTEVISSTDDTESITERTDVQAHEVPLYYDFKKDVEVFAYLKYGRRTINRDRSSATKFYSESYLQSQEPDELSVSDGSIIAIFDSKSRTSQERTVDAGSSDGYFSGYSTTINGSLSSPVTSIGSIDARFGACVLSVSKSETDWNASGDVFRDYDEIHPGSFFYANGTRRNTFTENVSIYSGGVEKANYLLYERQQTNDTISVDATLPGAEGRNDVIVSSISSYIPVYRPEVVINFLAYESAGIEFFSALCISGVSTNADQFAMLLAKSGQAGIVDDALALGDDVCLFDPGLI